MTQSQIAGTLDSSFTYSAFYMYLISPGPYYGFENDTNHFW